MTVGRNFQSFQPLITDVGVATLLSDSFCILTRPLGARDTRGYSPQAALCGWSCEAKCVNL